MLHNLRWLKPNMYYICISQHSININNMNHHRLLIILLSLSAMALSRHTATAVKKIQSPDKTIEVTIDKNNMDIHYGNERNLFTVCLLQSATPKSLCLIQTEPGSPSEHPVGRRRSLLGKSAHMRPRLLNCLTCSSTGSGT